MVVAIIPSLLLILASSNRHEHSNSTNSTNSANSTNSTNSTTLTPNPSGVILGGILGLLVLVPVLILLYCFYRGIKAICIKHLSSRKSRKRKPISPRSNQRASDNDLLEAGWRELEPINRFGEHHRNGNRNKRRTWWDRYIYYRGGNSAGWPRDVADLNADGISDNSVNGYNGGRGAYIVRRPEAVADLNPNGVSNCTAHGVANTVSNQAAPVLPPLRIVTERRESDGFTQAEDREPLPLYEEGRLPVYDEIELGTLPPVYRA